MKIKTDYPIIYDSKDYLEPVGAVNDDNCNERYISEIEISLNKKFSYLELGCAGGSIIDVLTNRGHDAYGIEGTDHPLKIGREAWKKWHNLRLFTCDLSKPFTIEEAPNFDVISAWEFMEHIPPYSINYLLAKLYQILNDDGVIYFGISTAISDYHLSVFSKEFWKTEYFSKLYETFDYPLSNKYREDYIGDHKSFFVMLKKIKGLTQISNEIIKKYESEKIFTNIK